MKLLVHNWTKRLISGFTLKQLLIIALGAGIATFGIFNIHQRSGITEGGIIGLVLLSNHWLGLSPAIVTPILDLTCYVLAFRFLGPRFIKVSAVSTLFVSLFYRLWEQFPPMLPNFSDQPFIAAVLGGIFLGTGVGLVIRQGGSSGGDDALALSIMHLTKVRISKAYLATDMTVLLLSLSYIPMGRIVFSLITVMLSSYLIDFIKEFRVASFSSLKPE